MIELALMGLMLAALAVTLGTSDNSSIVIGRRGILPYSLSLNRHICVYGPTRSGKTGFVRYLVKKLSRRGIVTILDWHGEYTDLDLLSISYDMVQIDISKIPLKLLTEIIGHGLGLNEPSMYMLYKILKNSKPETVRDVVNAVEEYFATTRTEAEMKAAILRRLEYVLSSMSRGVLEPEILVKESCCIDLSNLTVIEEKKLAASLILAMIYVYYMHSGIVRKNPTHFIVIEEAQNLLKEDNTILHHIILELAKYGVRVILITNVLPDTTILTHCTLLMFKIRPEYTKNIVISEDLYKIMNSMKDSEMLVITPSEISKIVPCREKNFENYIRPVKVVEEYIESKEDYVKQNTDSVSSERENVQVRDFNQVKRRDYMTMSNSDYSETKTVNNVRIDVTNYLKKVEDIESRLAIIRERLDEIERMLVYEDEVLKKIVEKILEERE